MPCPISSFEVLTWVFLRYNGQGDEEPSFRNFTPDCCREKAKALAADRATTLVPVITAQIIFIVTSGIAYFRTFSKQSGPQNWWSIEIHSIALSLTVIWVIVAVALGSLIGGSQSEQAISRILTGLGSHTDRKCAIAHGLLNGRENLWNSSFYLNRIFNGGLPSFRPDKWKRWESSSSKRVPARATAAKSMLFHCHFSIFIVSVGTLASFALSALVPPEGFGQHHIGPAIALSTWLASFLVQYLVSRSNVTQHLQFWIVMGKDIVSTAFNASIILATQYGILNRCGTWSHWGRTGVMLPSIKSVHDLLQYRMGHVFPVIIFSSISIQLVCCALIAWWYRHALRVYLQRDDSSSMRHIAYTHSISYSYIDCLIVLFSVLPSVSFFLSSIVSSVSSLLLLFSLYLLSIFLLVLAVDARRKSVASPVLKSHEIMSFLISRVMSQLYSVVFRRPKAIHRFLNVPDVFWGNSEPRLEEGKRRIRWMCVCFSIFLCKSSP